MAIVLPQGKQQFFDSNGNPAVGWRLYTYVAGTSTPKDTYTTSAGSVANTNPVVMNARGEAAIYWNGTYDATLKDASDVTVWGPERLYAPDLADWLTEADLASTASVGLGDALIGVKSTLSGGTARTQHSKNADVVSVKDFGAVGDGSTDDTAAIQAAVTALASTGGGAYFPSGTYKVTGEITVSSVYPISLIGDQAGHVYNAGVIGPAIIIGGSIAGSVFKYTAPDSGSRNEHGGGVIRGLMFIDPTGSGVTPGTRTVTAVLNLNDFALSRVENCRFQWINGRAILGEFVVMSTITGNTVRYSGATSKPVFDFPSTSSIFPAQSLLISDNRLEVNHDAAYINIGASVNSNGIKIVGNGFEADPATAASNQEFISLAASGASVVGNHFNVNTGVQLSLSGLYCAVNSNFFQGGAYTTTPVTVSGNVNSITGNTFASTRKAIEVLISGFSNVFSGNCLYSSGQLKLTGNCNAVNGNSIFVSTCTTADLGAGSDYWILDTGSLNVVSGNTLDNNNGTVTTVGGIRVTATCPSVLNNSFRAFNGSSNGAIAIRVESSNANVQGNTETTCTTFISATSYDGQLANNMPTTAAHILTGSATYNPGSLIDGAGETTTVTVTGAALGDYATAAFSLDTQGITITAWVSSSNTVSVRLQNESGGTLDIASGTLKVKVSKR